MVASEAPKARRMGSLEGAEAHRQHCGGHQQQGQRVAQDPLRLVLFSRPQLDGGQRRASPARQRLQRRTPA